MCFVSTAFLIFILDRLSKYSIKSFLTSTNTYPIIKGIFHFTLVENKGAAFGVFPGYSSFFLIVSFIAIFLIIYLFFKKKLEGKLGEISLGLILGGTLGNLYDRLVYGAVIDFLDFRIWPVFNLADSAITVGIILLMWICWKDKR